VTILQAEFKESIAHHARTDKALADLNTSLALLGQQIAELNAWKAQLRFLDDVRVEVAVQRRDLDEMRQWRQERSRKLWLILPPVLAALLSSLLTGWITYLLK